MKKLLFLLISLLVMIPTIASAHTEITSSNPAANQAVNEDLKEIVLTYGGKIESLSTMTLVKDGQKIPLASVTSKDNQLIGTLSAPLENGSYTIQWNIAGEDGHPIKGEIPFTVQKDQKTESKEPVPVKKEEPKKETAEPVQTNKPITNNSSNMKNIITVAIVVVLVIGLFLLFRKKR